MAGYVFPLDSGTFSEGRTDEGVDFGVQAGAPIRAIGAGIVDFVGQYRGFGPYIAYHLTEGPNAGTEIYDAEGQNILVRKGQRLKSGDVIGRATGASSGIEMGYAFGGGSYLPEASSSYKEGQITPQGSAFRSFLANLGGQNDIGGMTPAQRVEFLAQGAWRRGLDPGAVLADATGEGGFTPALPGDGGTSFGPFQLHQGGELPAGISDPQSWSWSPAGMNYALDRIKGVAYGLTGQEAITQIVQRFEQPANPSAEISKDIAEYNQASLANALPPAPHPELAGWNPTGTLPHAWQPWKREFWFPSTAPGAGIIGGVASGITSTAKLAEAAIWPFQHPMRAGQVFGGAILVLLGVYLLAKAAGIDVPTVVPIPV